MFKAATAKVNNFNGTLSWVLQENVLHVVSDESHRRGISKTYLWFQVTVDDPVVAHQAQGHDHLACEPPNQRRCEADEAICLDQFV